jgi:arylsulfatase
MLRGEPWARQQPICWEHEGNKAVRRGKWKLVRKFPGPWELYDMDEDRTELHDLSAQHPGLTQELIDIWEEWAQRCNVVPWEEIRPGRPAADRAATSTSPRV